MDGTLADVPERGEMDRYYERESIRKGCPVCFSFKRRFETGFLAMDRYDESGEISLLIVPGRGRSGFNDARCEIFIYPEDGRRPAGGQDWLSY